MRKLSLFAIAAVLGLSGSAMADVKLKTRQTTSGQTTENTTYIKGKRQRTEMMSGQYISLTQCDLGRDLQLSPQTKTYMVSLYNDGTQSAPQEVKAGATVPVTKGGTMYLTTTTKDTGERKQMFGYTARHIIQTIETESSPDACSTNKTKMEMDMWVIDAEFSLICNRNYDPTTFRGKNGGCTDKVVTKNLGTGKGGYPLWQKMTMFDATGKETSSIIQEVVELSKATLDASLFEAPADYREVKDTAQLYAAAASQASANDRPASQSYSSGNTNSSLPSSSGLSSTISKAASTSSEPSDAPALGAKKAGTVRIGVANVKTGAVGEGISAADLSAAIKNSLGEFLKGTKIEVVSLDAKLASAQAEEAKQKECDFVLAANVSHKKGGGGFGGFGKVFSAVAPVIPMAGGVGGMVAAQVVSTAITAASLSGNVKSKDEITLDVKVQSATDNSSPLVKQFKAKAKSDGDDIISAVVEQAAQAILDTVGK